MPAETHFKRVLNRRDLILYGLVILTPTAPYPLYGIVQQLSYGHAALCHLEAADVTGNSPPIAGIEGPCDMYVFHQAFGIPAVLWGPRGGNTHAADEYVEIDSLVDAAKTLLVFVSRWCGVPA